MQKKVSHTCSFWGVYLHFENVTYQYMQASEYPKDREALLDIIEKLCLTL